MIHLTGATMSDKTYATALDEFTELLAHTAAAARRLKKLTVANADQATGDIPTEIPPDLLKKFNTPITRLGLTTRSRHCLLNYEIVYVGQLVAKTHRELMGMCNFGHMSLKEVKQVLAQMGLRLGMNVSLWTEPTNNK